MPGITLTPDPSGDDWAQITAAFATLRTNQRGWVEFEQPTATPFNIKQCVDGTFLANADIRINPGVQIRCDDFVRNEPMFDFSNSYWFSMTGQGNIAGLISGLDGNSPVGTVKPNCAILFANGDSKRLENMATSGRFASAAVGIVNATDSDIIGGGLGNYDSSAPVLVISSNPDWGLYSPYTTFGSMGFCADIRIQTRLHGLGNQMWTTYMRNVHNIKLDHVLTDNNNHAHYLFQGQNSYVVATGGKAYAEIAPSTCQFVFECGGTDSVSNLKVIGLQPHNGLAMTNGTTNFPGLFVA